MQFVSLVRLLNLNQWDTAKGRRQSQGPGSATMQN